tara:strand:+ start:1618 stop:2817 length:1200 start_codon:yes stop_codon:yes gene_type:complete
MNYEKFKPDDIIINRIKAHPKQSFFIYDQEVYINTRNNLVGVNANEFSVGTGSVSLYELNIDRAFDYIEPSVVGYKTVLADKKQFNTMLGKAHSGSLYSPISSGNYRMSASITRIYSEPTSVKYLGVNQNKNTHILALQNSADTYTTLSKHYNFTSSNYLSRDLTEATVNIIDIPTIFYESSIKKGSVNLKFYLTGSLLAECADIKRNGELIQTTGSSLLNHTVGVVLYDQGVIVLTSSFNLHPGDPALADFDGGGADEASWLFYGAGANDGITHTTTINNASFNLEFEGTSYTNTMTLFCHADKGKYNYSNNPTFLESGSFCPAFNTSSYSYSEPSISIKNVVSSSYSGYEENFERTTYISKVGIYDKEGRLIMIASLAKPIRKRENDEYTFKLTYDI